MSTVTVKYPPRDMMPLVERSTLPDVPHRAHWWRVRILPDSEGVAYQTSIDNLDPLIADADSKATVTYSWADGIDETAEPYAARITTEHDEPAFLGVEHTRCVPSRATVWADVLDIEAPTSNPRWEYLTNPGDHRHPEDLQEIARLRAERGLVPMWVAEQLGKMKP